jgi:anion-transporting  ArsA/GET3 family ATPase
VFGAVLGADTKILFVSGKGGVGKSLVAAALAREQARLGRRVLLVEIGETSYYKDFWNLPRVDHVPVRHKEGFDLALWSGESCLHEYVIYYLRMERLYKLFFENKIMRALVNVAPGLNEMAILGKITSGIRHVGPELNYDLIVVDSFATGHALALLQAPRGMMEAVKFGPMGQHCREMLAVIQNPKLTSYVVVTLLEELPVTETAEFLAALKREFGVRASVVANRVMPLPVEPAELESLAHSGEKMGDSGMAEFSRYLLAVGRRQNEMMEQLQAATEVNSSGVIRLVPQIFSQDPEVLVREVGEALRNA